MSETTKLGRIILFVGLAAIFGLTFYQWAGGPGPPQIQPFPFPVFDNPFNARFHFNLTPTRDGSQAPPIIVNPAGVPNCHPGPVGQTWFGCVTTPDAGGSYVTLNNAGNQFRVGLSGTSGIPSPNPVLSVTVKIQCRSSLARTVDFDLLQADDSTLIADVQMLNACGANVFTNFSLQNFFIPPHPQVASFAAGNSILVVSLPNPGDIADVSYIGFDMVAGQEPECSNNNGLSYVGCILSNFFTDVFHGIVFLVNVGIFVGLWLIAATSLVAGVFGPLAWFLAIPGTPPLIQGILNVMIIGVVGMMVFMVSRLVRGASSG